MADGGGLRQYSRDELLALRESPLVPAAPPGFDAELLSQLLATKLKIDTGRGGGGVKNLPFDLGSSGDDILLSPKRKSFSAGAAGFKGEDAAKKPDERRAAGLPLRRSSALLLAPEEPRGRAGRDRAADRNADRNAKDWR